MSSALKKEHLPRYTYEDYCQWEGRWEIIDGIPYAKSPLPSGKHQWISVKLITLFNEALKSCTQCRASMPMDWKVNDLTVVQPDVFVACFDFRKLKYITETPVVAVEILSPSTRDKDVSLKQEIYQEKGVKYYLIVDPEDDTYKVLQLSGREYKVAQSGHDGSFTFEVEPNCKAPIDFGKIWD
jgi:Uma2 family endonuclease